MRALLPRCERRPRWPGCVSRCTAQAAGCWSSLPCVARAGGWAANAAQLPLRVEARPPPRHVCTADHPDCSKRPRSLAFARARAHPDPARPPTTLTAPPAAPRARPHLYHEGSARPAGPAALHPTRPTATRACPEPSLHASGSSRQLAQTALVRQAAGTAAALGSASRCAAVRCAAVRERRPLGCRSVPPEPAARPGPCILRVPPATRWPLSSSPSRFPHAARPTSCRGSATPTRGYAASFNSPRHRYRVSNLLGRGRSALKRPGRARAAMARLSLHPALAALSVLLGAWRQLYGTCWTL